MNAIINPGKLQGNITIPPSKSVMQRACAAALLHRGKTIITNPGNSDDDNATLQIIQQLGAQVTFTANNKIEIIADGIMHTTNEINCGESGLAARLFTPLIAICNEPIVLTGHGSLLHRTMRPYESILEELGVTLPGFSGHIPFTILGPIKPKNITVDGSLSSQFLTGLLFALSTVATEPITINVANLKSKPYIDLTIDVLTHFGKIIEHHNYQDFFIDPSKKFYKKEIEFSIAADWSSAAFWLVGAAINGNITIENLDLNSFQADKVIIDLLKNIGCHIDFTKGIHIASGELQPFQFDATDCPDLFPILAVLAIYCNGQSTIKGLHRLTHKESNRAATIQQMLEEMNVNFAVKDDELIIEGEKEINGGTINGHNDHRIIMAAAIAALKSKETVTIMGIESVSKSYPNFFDELSALGINRTLNP